MDTLPRDVTSVTKSEIEPFKQGRRVGCYLLGKTLGEGSFAKVKEGLHIITGEKVAVKIIDKKRAREDRYISKNLRREARIHQLVRHPNIIQLYEVLETDHFYYLVMEYCAGGELLDYICTRKRLEETVAKRIVAQLVSAVDGMHKSGVVHRDLKIENFLLNDNEDLKIIDFGLSNTLSLDAMQEYERTGVFPQLLNTHCGSPAYAAPELLAQKKYGPQVDVWSIGINMYAMLTGFLPYMMEPFNVMEMYEKMMQRRMTPIPGFLSKPCRDLLMRLLEPVADWRITLKQVMKHKWFSDSIHVPRSIPLGDMMYQKKELCESVLSYMKYNLKVRTKDTINAVVSNRAVHASAVYHLLVARLDRHLKEKKENIELNKQFAKVEVIKKSNLSTDNFHKASVPTSRSKRFTFRGKKIDGNNLLQQNLADNNELDNDNEHVNEDGLSANDDSVKYVQNKKESMKLKDEHASNSASNVIHSVPSPSDALEPQDQNLPQRNAPHRGHRRALSSVNPNEIRQAGEIHSTLRNSLCSDSKEDLSDITAQTPEQQPRSESPEDPFGKTGKGIVSRKISFDVRIGDLGSPNNGDKSIDVAKFLPESPKTSTSEKNKAKRKVSVDYPINESNVKEKKEPIPGWLITKIIKQPPLKEEPTNIQEQRSASVSPTSVDSVSSERNSPEYLGGDSEKSKTQRKTIRRPETPEKLRESQRSDLNDDNNSIDDNDDESTDSNRSSVSDRLHTFMKNNLPNNVPGFQEKTGKHDNPKYPKDSNEISDAVVNELLNNVRNITENYLKDNEEEKSRRKITEQHSNNISKKDSSTQSSKTPSPPLNISSDSLNTGRSTSRTSSTKSPDSLDENNNNTNNVARNSKTKDDKKTQKINTKTLRNNSIRGRILALENYEQKIRNKRTAKAEANSVSPIKKITISKKTLELNVKQFQQFKADQKSETANLHSNIHSNNNRVPNRFFYTENTVNHNKLITSPKSPLKPLELKFDFQRRKKKVYKDRQQTRSLTDVTNGILGKVDTKPKEEQMLIPKHRCNNNCTEADGCCKGEDTSMEKDPTEIRSVYDSSGTINIEADNNSVSVEERQPTMKITAHNTNNRTKIFLSAKKITSVSIPTNQDNVVVTSPIKNNNISHEKHLTDSGYFGTNSFPPAYEEFHSTITKESAGHNLDSIVEATEKMKKQPMEIHSVKYRCIPVYQLEYMKTGTIHNKDQLDVIIEENNRYRDRQDEAGFIHRKWGSQTIEPTQDPVDYIPRPAEIIINTREKFQKERLKKMEQLKTESRRLDFMTRSKSVDNSPSLDYNRIRTQKQQFPSDTSVINDSSPKYNRQSTYGTVNRNRTAPATPCTSPTVCDRTIEKQKILAFTHALETAAWRKRSVLSATN